MDTQTPSCELRALSIEEHTAPALRCEADRFMPQALLSASRMCSGSGILNLEASDWEA